MAINAHQKPHLPNQLITLHYLRSRMELTPALAQHYDKLQRGYTGEKKFYERMTHILPEDTLTMYSLDLPHRDTSFQLDNILFFSGTIYLFEIKYFFGDYTIDGGNWFATTGSMREINNPFTQLKRASSFFRQLSSDLGWSGNVIGQLVFMHEAFTLYGARPDDPIIFLSQFDRKIRRMLTQERPAGSAELRLAHKLAARHQTTNRYEQPINYDYNSLWKGLVCPTCTRRMQRTSQRSFLCPSCGGVTQAQQAIIYNIRQYAYLFPDRPVTVRAIFDWLGGEVHRDSIRRTLTAYGETIKPGRNAHYRLK